MLETHSRYEQKRLWCIAFNVHVLFRFLKTTRNHCVGALDMWLVAVLYAPQTRLRTVLVVEAVFAYFRVAFAGFRQFKGTYKLKNYSRSVSIVWLHIDGEYKATH